MRKIVCLMSLLCVFALSSCAIIVNSDDDAYITGATISNDYRTITVKCSKSPDDKALKISSNWSPRPVIVGLAKNDSKIVVELSRKLVPGEIITITPASDNKDLHGKATVCRPEEDD